MTVPCPTLWVTVNVADRTDLAVRKFVNLNADSYD